MNSLVTAFPAIHEMGITDSQGNAIAQSIASQTAGMNYAGQEYFRFHATHFDRRPFIATRVKSKIDGSYAITVTRRINRPDGSFGGVAVASVSMMHFQQLLDRAQNRSGGVVALLADDGPILARSPPVVGDTPTFNGESEVEQQMRDHPYDGSLAYISPIDGVRRYGSYHRMDQFPLSALVSQSVWDLQGRWRAELQWHSIILACVTIVGVVLGLSTIKADRVLKTSGHAGRLDRSDKPPLLQ